MNKFGNKLRTAMAIVSILILLSVMTVGAADVVVDDFSQTDQLISYTIQSGDSFPIYQSNFSATAAGEALGDHRDVCLEITGGNVNGVASTRADAFNDYLQMALAPSVSGIVTVQWDGTEASCTIAATGLSPSEDLTDSGSNDGILLRVIDSDGLPVDITMRIYTDASNWEEQTVRLDTVVSTGDVVDIFMPFDDFAPGAGTMNEAAVGAAELELDGTIQAGADMTIKFVKATSVRDYGDLDTSTWAAASHVPDGLRLGDQVDAEASTFSSANATGDDTNDTDDEDGVTRMTGAGNPAHGGWTNGTVSPFDDASSDGGSVEIVVTGGSGYPQVFVDWNSDGTFSEVTLRDLLGNALSLPFAEGTHRVYFDVPAGTFNGSSSINLPIRVRLSQSGSLSQSGAASTAQGGEVEDYLWAFGPNAVTLSSVGAQAGSAVPIIVAFAFVGLMAVGALVVVRRRA